MQSGGSVEQDRLSLAIERTTPQLIETIFSAELPVGEHLLIQRNRIVGTAGPGPRIAVVTGTHGDELEGQYVAFELARILQANLGLLHGTVDIYPAINPLGINSIQRGVPLFDIDLNRTFPGDARGSLTETYTAAVIDHIRGADVAVDIHASNIFLREMPQVRINELSAERLLGLAPLLNVDYVWVHASATVLESTLAYALNSTGTPCLVVETGVGMRITDEYGHRLTQGLLRLAAHLGAWDGPYEASPAPIVSRDGAVSYANASRAGIFLPKATHGTVVEKGQLIGIVADPLAGEVMEEIVAQEPGLLFTLREYPIVYPGSLLARILVGVMPEDVPSHPHPSWQVGGRLSDGMPAGTDQVSGRPAGGEPAGGQQAGGQPADRPAVGNQQAGSEANANGGSR